MRAVPLISQPKVTAAEAQLESRTLTAEQTLTEYGWTTETPGLVRYARLRALEARAKKARDSLLQKAAMLGGVKATHESRARMFAEYRVGRAMKALMRAVADNSASEMIAAVECGRGGAL